jgi:hypothetical protein
MKLRVLFTALALAGCASTSGTSASPPGQPGIAVGEPAPRTNPGTNPDDPKPPSGVAHFDKKLDLGDWKGPLDPDKLSDAFAAQLDARYGPEPGLQTVKTDLESNGFTCKDVPPVEATANYLMATCTRQEMHQQCGNIWSVSIRFNHLSRALDSTRVLPTGGFERLCLGANPG